MGRKPRRSGAQPGGASNAAKRQRISQLDSRHRSEAHRKTGPLGPPRAAERGPNAASEVYDPLSAALRSGPHCAVLKLPSVNPSHSEQNIKGMLGGIARTDPSNYPDKISGRVSEGVGSRPFLLLKNDRSSKPSKGQQPAVKGGLMSKTARKKKGLDPLQANITLASLEEMHAVWEGTAAEMAVSMADGLVAQRIDYHGCRLRVVKCCNPQLVGREGVAVKDSTTTIHLGAQPPNFRDEEDATVAKLYHVPKIGTTFAFELPGRGVDPRQITIQGSELGRQPRK